MRAEIRSMLAAAGLAIAGYSIVAGAAPRVQTGPNAEVTHDGLTRVDKSVMDVAYVKADLDLRPYKKLWLVGADLSGLDDAHIRDHAALRCQVRRIGAGAFREPGDVVGEQRVEKRRAIGACQRNLPPR